MFFMKKFSSFLFVSSLFLSCSFTGLSAKELTEAPSRFVPIIDSSLTRAKPIEESKSVNTRSAVSTYIYNPVTIPPGTPYYTRTEAIPSPETETNSFIQSIVPLSAAPNLYVDYLSGLDLAPLVALWCPELSKPLREVGFEGEHFIFSLPKEYLADDEQHTNQQWFAQLDGSVLSVNSNALINGLTPAIGRTPVVRVDAYLPDNDGNVQMVASSYIKCEFVVSPSQEPPLDDLPPLSIFLPDNSYDYFGLSLDYADNSVLNMDGNEIINKIYAPQGLSPLEFWKAYSTDFTITCDVATNDEGGNRSIFSQQGSSNEPFEYINGGIKMYANFNLSHPESSVIQININNEIKGENTYWNYKGRGAKYKLTLHLQPLDLTYYNPINIVQEFYVNQTESGNTTLISPIENNVNISLSLDKSCSLLYFKRIDSPLSLDIYSISGTKIISIVDFCNDYLDISALPVNNIYVVKIGNQYFKFLK